MIRIFLPLFNCPLSIVNCPFIKFPEVCGAMLVAVFCRCASEAFPEIVAQRGGRREPAPFGYLRIT